jgi:UPF0042 nucleotide-binding protein
MRANADPQVLIVTGLSGAGKSTALNCLEDMGFYCVDNLPPALFTKFLELSLQLPGAAKRIAWGMDVRSGDFFNDWSTALKELQKRRVAYDIVYLEAAQDVLIRRYKESRRSHPLAHGGGGLLESIRSERERLREVKGAASVVIDTSELKPQDIRVRLYALYGRTEPLTRRLSVGIMSFGYKAGVPLDADLVMDVRFLPNPFYIPELKPQTGRDRKVADYVLSFPVTRQFIDKFIGLLVFLLPFYVAEGKRSLTVAIGCTGGQHRSVVLADTVAARLKELDYAVYVQHRELDRSGA